MQFIYVLRTIKYLQLISLTNYSRHTLRYPELSLGSSSREMQAPRLLRSFRKLPQEFQQLLPAKD